MQTQHDHAPIGADRGSARRADVLDDALDRLAAYRFVDGPGMATHGPMAAEALSCLGHDHLVAGWVEQYKLRHQVIVGEPASNRIDADEDDSWRAAIGQPTRLSDWADLFTRQLRDRAWPEVLQAWVPRLLPGYGGAFTHGLIRTAHAVRALQTSPTASSLVIGELAMGLAYWAGTHKTLPGQPGLGGTRSLAEAIDRLPRPQEVWTPVEAAQFSNLHELPDFPAAVEALGPPASMDEALTDLTTTFVRLMLANSNVHPIGLVHTVTPVAGARTLLPFLPTVSAEHMYTRLWHVNAAIAVGFTPPSNDQVIPIRHDADTPAPQQLAARAAEHQDPHVIKFTEACLREHTLRPDPAYLLAAQHVIDRTPPW